MDIAVASDLHLEFGTIELHNTEEADVLILSGDICVAADLLTPAHELDRFNRSATIHTFFQQCCSRFPNVIYVAGNHEHYHGDFPNTIKRLKEHLGYLVNLHILDKESVIINDTTFIGGTLWTDMNKEDKMTMAMVKGLMNDFRIITDTRIDVHYRDQDGNSQIRTGKLTPETALADHKDMLEYIRLSIEGKYDQRFIVVGHHAPSKASTKPKYEKEVVMNGAYSSDLNDFMIDHPQIKAWIHGHTHDGFDYMVGSTRVICNPRGYIHYEDSAENFQLKYYNI